MRRAGCVLHSTVRRPGESSHPIGQRRWERGILPIAEAPGRLPVPFLSAPTVPAVMPLTFRKLTLVRLSVAIESDAHVPVSGDGNDIVGHGNAGGGHTRRRRWRGVVVAAAFVPSVL